jgi:hypothetical protein
MGFNSAFKGLRMRGVISLLPLYVFMVRIEKSVRGNSTDEKIYRP